MIHATAIIAKSAKLGAQVKVGPYAIIDENVVIGDNCFIGPHAHIEAATIGNGNYIGDGAIIGAAPQDLKYKNEKTFVKIGNNNVIREYASIHRASHEGEATILGDNNFLMTLSHVAHDCVLGNNIILINGVALAGHVTIHDNAVLSAYTLVHQNCRVGKFVMAGGGTKIIKDIAPFCMVDGNNATINGLNKLGLKRNGFKPESIKAIEDMYAIFFRDKTLLFAEAINKIEKTIPQTEEVKYFVEFVKASKRGIER
ncbi:MAG: acyl-ACP--UDP-N-acetylglucosamine O-acyltransferase [bacterium]